ncbi:MAG TPA: NUDIX hydrolase [Nitrospira sp.]|nr:NUDIX hydrolase [Nitrospira sp.]
MRCGISIGMTAMNFCGECGKSVSKKIPHGDNLPRFVCDSCEAIHYHNPKIVAGCIPEWDGQILLCRRAIEPKAGLWTYPAGFMEIGEGTEEAARRETLEEARAQVTITRLHSVISLPHIGQVYLTFIGRLNAREFAAGQESLDVRLFDQKDIPWDAIAFPVVKDALLRYMDDLERGSFRLHVADLPDRLR